MTLKLSLFQTIWVAFSQNNGNLIKGLYVCGWAKRGPSGIIDATLRDTHETFTMIKNHLKNDILDTKVDSTRKTLYNIDK